MRLAAIYGAVLAGGLGARIGGDKALIDLGGEELVSHAARPLRELAALAVVGDAEAARRVGAVYLSDPDGAARGPLAGVSAALEWAQPHAEWVVVTPCDMPFLPNDLVSRLTEEAARAGAPLVCARGDDGIQPLVSLWRSDLAGAARAALREGRHPPVHDFVARLGTAYLRLNDNEIANVNTPAELAAARARWSAKGQN